MGNGDPNCQESDKEPKRSLFNGLAQVIVQSTQEPGEIHIEAVKEGWAGAELTPFKLTITTQKSTCVPRSSSVRQRLCGDFYAGVCVALSVANLDDSLPLSPVCSRCSAIIVLHRSAMPMAARVQFQAESCGSDLGLSTGCVGRRFESVLEQAQHN